VSNILGNKVGMTQIFSENGNAIPVTVIKVGPCIVLGIKSIINNGYNAIQIGYQPELKIKLNKSELGYLEKKNILPVKYLKEYRVPNEHNFKVGQILDTTIFQEGQFVDITGKSIGKGFSGNVKRNNFSRGPMTHGSKNHREPGSIGQSTTPGRVFPGKKMAGRLGYHKVTISKLKIVKIDKNENLLIIKGSVPGKPGNILNLRLSKLLK